jgi:DNA-binding transcriptional regulator YiaG
MDSRILDELEACYADELSLVSKDLGSLENEVVTLMRELGRGLIQRVVSKQRNGYKGSSMPCSCGHWMRFVGYRSKTIHTLLGWITLERPYYYCPKYGASCFPYDQASGLGPECLSAGLAKACCMLAVNNSFSETSRMVEDVFGQAVSDKTIERVVHQVGSVVLQQQRESLDTFRKDRQMPACDAPPERLYIAADGTTVHEQDGWQVGALLYAVHGCFLGVFCRVSDLQRKVNPLEKHVLKNAPSQTAETDANHVRFTAKGLRSQRKRLEISAANYGKLIGVTGQTIYSWKHGTARPRKQQLARIASLRGMGKREARARLEQLAGEGRKRLK